MPQTIKYTFVLTSILDRITSTITWVSTHQVSVQVQINLQYCRPTVHVCIHTQVTYDPILGQL